MHFSGNVQDGGKRNSAWPGALDDSSRLFWPPLKREVARRSRGAAAARQLGLIALARLLVLLLPATLRAQDNPPGAPSANFARRVETIFATCEKRAREQPNDDEAAWQFGRACFDWADLADSRARRAEIAGQGIAVCRKLLERSSNSVPGRYYLGMNLAQLAQTKRLGALEVVKQMEREFTLTLALDPKFDFGGADRNLGLLYLESPGWPLSIGDDAKARKHLQAAVTQAPEYPENRLNLIDALLRWGARADAREELEALGKLWPAAKKQFNSEQWASSWPDWEKRRASLSRKAGIATAPGGP